MKEMHTKYLYLILLLFLVSIPGISQPPRGPWVISPQVHPDKTVTFQYLAPDANEVKLDGQFQKGLVDMTKGEHGIWSVTVGPIEPDIYPYSFRVDGITVMDPANELFFPNERFKASLVDIPGDKPLIHAMQDVVHGTVNYEYYPSVEGTTGSLVVYTPPGYEKNPDKKYPVFYLISGTTDTEETFYKVGRVNFILDNLIAQGKANPMIIVMPYGNLAAQVAAQKGSSKPGDPMGRESSEAVKRSNQFEDDLINNVIPFIDQTYRTLSNSDGRAIGGFSWGGGQTLRAAFGNMDKFGYVCCYSAYLSQEEIETNYKHVVDNPKRTNKMFKMLWVSVGNEDFLYKQTAEFMEYLKSKQVNYKSLITSGGHTWMNVRDYVAETSQLLFK